MTYPLAMPLIAMLMDLPPHDRRLIGRFMERVEMVGEHAIWRGTIEPKGYGRFFDGHRNVLAHRWLYEIIVGPIPEDKQLHHRCEIPACVHPYHMEPLTAVEHNAITHPRVTVCPKGHPYDDVNTRWYEGRRYCRTCNNNGRRPVRRSHLPELHAARREAGAR
jgi:hypothetical protein